MRNVALILTLVLITSTAHSSIKLESTVLRRLDGVWPAFDGQSIYEMIQMGKKYRNMCLGEIKNPKTKERVGKYTFRGKKYGLAALADIEKQYANNKQAQSELKKILDNAKEEFCEMNRKFISQIQRFKPLIIQIMQESCQKRNVPHSFMLRWTNTQAGQEEESFKAKMPSISEINKFFNELVNFFSDIIGSCPKGVTQYRDLLTKMKH
jgi:hypothetical protein